VYGEEIRLEEEKKNEEFYWTLNAGNSKFVKRNVISRRGEIGGRKMERRTQTKI